MSSNVIPKKNHKSRRAETCRDLPTVRCTLHKTRTCTCTFDEGFHQEPHRLYSEHKSGDSWKIETNGCRLSRGVPFVGSVQPPHSRTSRRFLPNDFRGSWAEAW